MGLEIVLKEIEVSINNEIMLINSEALKKSEEIIEEARKQVRESLGSQLANIEEHILKKQQQIISSSNLEVKRLQLNKKRELLDLVYSKTVETINSMTQTNEKLLEELIKKHESSGSKIYSNKKTEHIVRKLSKLHYAGTIDCICGIVIENEDGSIKEDYTYDLILKNVYERSLKAISEILNW